MSRWRTYRRRRLTLTTLLHSFSRVALCLGQIQNVSVGIVADLAAEGLMPAKPFVQILGRGRTVERFVVPVILFCEYFP